MNVNERNRLFLKGDIDREDLWPKYTEFQAQARTFRFQLGLETLPEEPGVLFIRGPRQFGKSTWLEGAMIDTLEDFGAGTALFINGDYIRDNKELEERLVELERLFPAKAKVKRIFIDEVTSVHRWELALKRLIDSGHLRDVLVVTTGSQARDIRRGSERLPGRKGKLNKTEFALLGITYKDFYTVCNDELGDSTWIAYMLGGASPIACKELWQFEKVPEYFVELTRDWIFGELIKVGRNRIFLLSLMRNFEKFGTAPVGYLKLARESGMANNTVASEYVEHLADLMCILPSFQWDSNRKLPQIRKPCKFHFVNLAAALVFNSYTIRSVHDYKQLPNSEKAKWLEWLVAHELYKRAYYKNSGEPESLYFWKSETHEIDFVQDGNLFFEVKLGKASPTEFAWFGKRFPKDRLIVICETPFETKNVKGVTIEQFLLADGLPHPYPGQVEDENVYNDLLDFTG